MPGSYPDPGRAQRQHRGQRLGRGGQRPAVISGEPGDQRRVVDLATVVLVMPVQPGLPRIGRAGLGEPERTAASDRLRVGHRAEEPVPGLAAADRAAYHITPGLRCDRDVKGAPGVRDPR